MFSLITYIEFTDATFDVRYMYSGSEEECKKEMNAIDAVIYDGHKHVKGARLMIVESEVLAPFTEAK